MSRMGLTARQRQCLDYISAFITQHGWSPSYEEIAQHLGLQSRSGAHRVIKSLVERGHLRQLGSCRDGWASPRSLEVVGRLGPAMAPAVGAEGSTRSVVLPAYHKTDDVYRLLDNLLAETLREFPCSVTITVAPIHPTAGGQP